MTLPRVEVPADREKIQRLIAALEQQIKADTSEKDRLIHQKAVEDLRKALGRGNNEVFES